MQYGSSIKGSATNSTNENWIDLNSFSISASRSVSGNNSSMRQIGLPSMNSFSVSKNLDAASLLLVKECLQGKGSTVKLEFLKTSENGLEAYMTYTFEDCLITNHSISSNGSAPTETMCITFSKFDQTFKDYDEEGKPKGNTAVSYDFKTMK